MHTGAVNGARGMYWSHEECGWVPCQVKVGQRADEPVAQQPATLPDPVPVQRDDEPRPALQR